MSMENLELKKIEVFGWTSPTRKCWKNIAEKTLKTKWNVEQAKIAELSLSRNVKKCYQALFECQLQNLDDSLMWTIFFDNQKKLFDVKLTNASKPTEILPQQKSELFKTDYVKRIVDKAYQVLIQAKAAIDDVLDDHILAGEMLQVDETKLAAILDMLEDQRLLKNFRLRKYTK